MSQAAAQDGRSVKDDPAASLLTVELIAKKVLENPPPENVDLTEEQDKEIQELLAATKGIPDSSWNAFIAKNLPKLVSVLKAASRETQKEYVSTLIQILSLFPDPKQSAYLRRFLANSELCEGLPTLIARHFVDGITWKSPSGPGHVCTLIIHTIHWCDTSLGDDKKSSIDKDIRAHLRAKLGEMIPEIKGNIDRYQDVEVNRLHGLLGALEHLPGDQYARSTRDYLEGQVDLCAWPRCDMEEDEALLRCSKCKVAKYCGQKCQTKHWKNGHKTNCFEPTF